VFWLYGVVSILYSIITILELLFLLVGSVVIDVIGTMAVIDVVLVAPVGSCNLH
jgi:hypothetical protein